jgi:hypothetical protein
LPPMAVGKLPGFAPLAALLNAPMHCRTCVGSFCSYRSTVRNVSCWWRFSGGAWHARRKCDMFSIWTKGMGDFLNLIPGGGTARLMSLHTACQYEICGNMGRVGSGWVATHLQSATPSLRPSRRSDDGSFSPSMSSIHDRTSLAAAGVYLSRRILRRSLSREDTDAMMKPMQSHCAYFRGGRL